jgi:dTDP-4-amino-4,6-dideoxygalactose transaminase
LIKPKQQIGVGGFRIHKREKEYLKEVINSNRLSYGPKTQKFETLFANLHECKYGIFTNSGTSALHISLAALKEKYSWKNNDSVIVPSITFIATSNIVLHNNMKPIFVDIDKKTYNIDPSLIEEKITDKTRAIIPVHLFGLPCDMDPIMKIAKDYNLKIIEDSCETIMARYKGKMVGSFGDIACFSTYIAHILTTGVGGFAITNNDEIAIFLKSLMNHGRDSIYLKMDDDKGKKGADLFEMVSRRFKFIHLGHSFRTTELEAAIGLGQLDRIKKIISQRKKNAEYLIKNLKDLEDYIQLPHIPNNRDHVFMMFPIVLNGQKKKDIVNFLEENLIETRDMLPLLNQPIYKKEFGEIEDNYPVARLIDQSGFYIGCHQYLKETELKYIIEKFYEYFERK